MRPPTDRQIERAGETVRKATALRDSLIRVAVADGRSLRQIGQLVGLSHTAIRNIVNKDNTP